VARLNREGLSYRGAKIPVTDLQIGKKEREIFVEEATTILIAKNGGKTRNLEFQSLLKGRERENPALGLKKDHRPGNPEGRARGLRLKEKEGLSIASLQDSVLGELICVP